MAWITLRPGPTSFDDGAVPVLDKILQLIEDAINGHLDTINLSDGAVTQVKVAANSLDGTVAKNVGDNAATAGLMLVYSVAVPAGVTGNVDIVVTHKVRVVDVHLVKRSAGAGGTGTIRVGNGANPITDAMTLPLTDQTIVAAGTIDDAFRDIAAGGTLRVTRTRTTSTDETCDVYVSCMRVA